MLRTPRKGRIHTHPLTQNQRTVAFWYCPSLPVTTWLLLVQLSHTWQAPKHTLTVLATAPHFSCLTLKVDKHSDMNNTSTRTELHVDWDKDTFRLTQPNTCLQATSEVWIWLDSCNAVVWWYIVLMLGKSYECCFLRRLVGNCNPPFWGFSIPRASLRSHLELRPW